ncbi:hypothetical protein D3C72_275840 [compost metagenome]
MLSLRDNILWLTWDELTGCERKRGERNKEMFHSLNLSTSGFSKLNGLAPRNVKMGRARLWITGAVLRPGLLMFSF